MNISLASTRLVAGFWAARRSPSDIDVAKPGEVIDIDFARLKRVRVSVEGSVDFGWIERRLTRRGHANEV